VSGFACMECGHKFRTIAAAERAAFGPDGCPRCGGADIDEVAGPREGSRNRGPDELTRARRPVNEENTDGPQ
jgi:predicted  nucleic acid-binding Zn-ribbon protein